MSNFKLLFLDIDGVLGTHSSRYAAHLAHENGHLTYRGWSLDCVNQLKRVIAETGCQLVISSDWRLPHAIDDLREGFDKFELPDWIGITPALNVDGHRHSHGVRGTEISMFLHHFTAIQKDGSHNTFQTYAIVDDNDWMLPSQEPVFVQTNDDAGLTAEKADKLIQILNHN